jgi:alpha-L-fucosidase
MPATSWSVPSKFFCVALPTGLERWFREEFRDGLETTVLDNVKVTRRSFACFATGALSAFANSKSEAEPFGAVPSRRQIQWSELEFYNFLHFTVNTFTDREWGYGDEDPSVFNPTAFDANAILEVLKSAGSKGVILTCKHHDGFCLWPTKTTEHSIKHSPYKNGKGDVVREISQAAHRSGLKFGVYLSPWDRNQASYGTPQYIQIYRQQMRELLTGYGPIFEIWHDGANGGDGYYGGSREKRIIDKLHYYDWPGTWALERQLQPDAAIFSDVGPDVRWVGNEKGIAGETCWATYTPRSPSGGPGSPGDIVEAEATTGTRMGKYWMPAECDVSIRPGWFWHPAENDKVKAPRALMNLYLDSVGRGASFLLNVPPDRRGRIHENDRASLRAFGELIQATFARDLAANARRSVSGSGAGLQIVLDLPQPQSFNLVRLREQIQFGQRVGAFSLDTLQNGAWQPFASGTSIGICRIVRSEQPVITRRVRLRITDSFARPLLSEFGLFHLSD